MARTHGGIGFMQLAIASGFGLFYAAYLSVFFGVFSFFPAGGISFSAQHGAQVAFFGGCVAGSLALLAYYRAKDRTDLRLAPALYGVSAIAVMPLVVCAVAAELGVPVPLLAAYGASFLAGLSAAVGFSFWEGLSLRGYLKRSMFMHGVIFAGGGILFLICVAGLARIPLILASALMFVASTALMAFIDPRAEAPGSEPVAPAAAFFRQMRHIDVVTYLINAAFGLAFVLLYGFGPSAVFCAFAVAVLVGLITTLVIGRDRILPFFGLLRIVVAVAVLGLVLFALPSASVKLVGLSALVVCWFAFRVLNGGAVVELAARGGLPVLFANIRGKLSSNVGFVLGLAGGVAVTLPGVPEGVAVYMVLGLVVALAAGALFLLPFQNESTEPGYQSLVLVEPPIGSEGASGRPEFAAACVQLSERCKLSARESEVLTYVMQGRNAKHVAERLYLSESTVKTHMANIYRKTGVHSQQELMDLIEK